MKCVAITGATSMIGTALIRECIEQGIKVLALVRPNSRNLTRLPSSDLVIQIPCNLENLADVPLLDDRCDTFYHLGWSYTPPGVRNDPLLQSYNIVYSQQAVQLAKRLKCSQFIFVGSQAEYGYCQECITPETPAKPFIAYGMAKYAAGELCGLLCRQLGIKYQRGRVFSVYGYYDNEWTLIRTTIEAVLNGREPAFSPCEQKWDYLFCTDAGRALYLMGEYGVEQAVYCIASGQTHLLREYVVELGQAMNVDLRAYIGKIPYAHDPVIQLDADISSLTRDTGFQPTVCFGDGIQKTVQWQKSLRESK